MTGSSIPLSDSFFDTEVTVATTTSSPHESHGLPTSPPIEVYALTVRLAIEERSARIKRRFAVFITIISPEQNV
jgi:hypothetical protein